RRNYVVEDAVNALADPQFLLVGLDVDVARALLDRRHQHDVDEPDHRRVFALARQRLGADLLPRLENFDVVGAGAERVLQLLEAAAGHFERAAGGRRVRAPLAALRARRAPFAARVVLL